MIHAATALAPSLIDPQLLKFASRAAGCRLSLELTHDVVNSALKARCKNSLGNPSADVAPCPWWGTMNGAGTGAEQQADRVLDGAGARHGQHDRVRRFPAASQSRAFGLEFGYRLDNHGYRRAVRGSSIRPAEPGLAQGGRALCLYPRSFWRWRRVRHCLGVLDIDVGRQCRDCDRRGELSQPAIPGGWQARCISGLHHRLCLVFYPNQYQRSETGGASPARLDHLEIAAAGRGHRPRCLCAGERGWRRYRAICSR